MKNYLLLHRQQVIEIEKFQQDTLKTNVMCRSDNLLVKLLLKRWTKVGSHLT